MRPRLDLKKGEGSRGDGESRRTGEPESRRAGEPESRRAGAEEKSVALETAFHGVSRHRLRDR